MSKHIWTLLSGIIVGASIMFVVVSMRSEHAQEMGELREVMHGLKTYQAYADLTKNSEAMAMMALDGLIESRIDVDGEAVVEHLQEMIERSPNPAIRNAIRFRLAEIYFDLDKPEDSLELLEEIILNAGATLDKSALPSLLE